MFRENFNCCYSLQAIFLHARLSNENGTLAEIGTFSIELLHEQKVLFIKGDLKTILTGLTITRIIIFL